MNTHIALHVAFAHMDIRITEDGRVWHLTDQTIKRLTWRIRDGAPSIRIYGHYFSARKIARENSERSLQPGKEAYQPLIIPVRINEEFVPCDSQILNCLVLETIQSGYWLNTRKAMNSINWGLMDLGHQDPPPGPLTTLYGEKRIRDFVFNRATP